MKNFRKVLALVLVVATLLSFATMASADYKDQASIAADYEVAVDVLTGFGIISGDETGNFRPTDEIDRDEVAKMVAVLCNGGEDIEAYYADACTFADTKNTWAAGYVAYCYHTGIIDGRNATTFDPNASITGYEVAKMLLCVLGFDADEQGYVGKDWKVNVLRDARNFGLLDGLGSTFNLKNNIKRQEVAQMMLTLLETPVVLGTLSDNIIKITNAAYADLGISLKDLGVADSEYALVYGNVIIIPGQVLANVYGYGHNVVIDCYGRPYSVWAGENEVTGKKWSVTRPYAKGAALGEKATGTTYVFLNGDYIGSMAKDDKIANFQKDLTRDGLVVETYATPEGTIVAAFETEVAVVTNTYKYQSVNYYDVDFANSAWEDLTKQKNTEGYTVDTVLYATFCDGTKDTCGAKLDLAKRITTETTKFGVYFEKATPVAVKVTDVNSSTERYPANWNQTNTTFWSGKTAYDYHEANIAGYYANGVWNAAAYMDEAAIGKTYNVYMNNGYVIAWTPYVAADTATYGVAYFEGDTWYAMESDTLINGNWQYTYFINDMIDFTAKDNDGVQVVNRDTAEFLKANETNGLLATYKVSDGKLSLLNTEPQRADSIDIAKGEVGGINAHQIVNTTKILVKVGGKYEAHTWASLKAEYGNLLLSGTYNVQYFVDGQKVTYLFVEATSVVEDGYFFIVDWNQTRTSDQIKAGERVWVEEYKAIVNGENVTMWFDVDLFEQNEAGLAAEDLIGGLFNVKVRYLGVTIDGEPIYYVDEEAQLLRILPIEFDHIDSGKIFSGNEGATVELHLADKYAITVIDYTELDANEDGEADKTDAGETKIKYVGLKGVYTTEEAFNAEFKDNDGYYYAAYVEYDAAGYVTNLFLVRIAEV